MNRAKAARKAESTVRMAADKNHQKGEYREVNVVAFALHVEELYAHSEQNQVTAGATRSRPEKKKKSRKKSRK